MKKLTITLALLLAPLAITIQAKSDPEAKVEITLKEDGKTITGEITNFWYGPFKLEQNRNFTIIDDQGNKIKLTADDVTTITFINDTTASLFETAPVAVPSLADSRRVLNWIVGISARSEHATVYWWNYFNQNETRLGGMASGTTIILNKSGKSICYGIKIKGSDTVYPFYYPGNGGLNLSVMNAHLKNTNPQWTTYLKDHLRDNKEAKKQLKQNPDHILTIYEDYLTTTAQ